MTTLLEISSEFNKLATNLPFKVQATLDVEGRFLRDALKSRTPVQSARLRQSWRIKKQSGGNFIAGFLITNPISYGAIIEEGVDKSLYPNHPWVVSFQKKTKGKTKVRKVTSRAGKIYSKSAVGGITTHVITPAYTLGLTKRIADSIVESLL